MRLCFIFVVLLEFASRANVKAQDQVVSLDLKNVHYYELFNEIHKQTGVRFIYNTNQLEKMSLINVHAKKKKVSDYRYRDRYEKGASAGSDCNY